MQLNSYIFLLCVTVYVGLVALFSTTIAIITTQTIKLTRLGAEDEKIKKEYLKNKDKKQSVIWGIINLVIPIIACTVMLTLFIGSVVVGALKNNVVGDVPVLKVVQTASMAQKYEKNEYLFENDLNDQLQVYDLIFVHKLPEENDLKQYDIVVYEVEPGVMLVHRIVNIEEPNASHPNERYFLLQGDNVAYPDKFPVKYSQMKGIYRGTRIPFMGTIAVFMQSAAGVLCVMLIVFASIFMPFIEKRLNKEKKLRLIFMGLIKDGDKESVSEQEVAVTEIPAKMQTLFYVESADKKGDGATLENDLNNSKVLTETTATSDVQSAPITQTKKPINSLPIKEVENDKFVLEEAMDFSAEQQNEASKKWYHSLKGKKGLTFRQKHDMASKEVIARYNQIVIHLYKLKGLHVWEGKSCETYKKGRMPICKIAFKGKSFSVYLALNPLDYQNTKYVYTQTTAKSYKDYPMTIKVTSDRQAKWVCELITELANKNGLYMYAMSRLFTIKGSDKTLNQKLLESTEQTRQWFNDINQTLLGLNGIRVINAKKQITYKVKNKNIARIKIIGKTLNLYLALEPKKFKNTKYKFIDVSSKKAYKNYPMRVKITSNRQAKWAIELIQKI